MRINQSGPLRGGPPHAAKWTDSRAIFTDMRKPLSRDPNRRSVRHDGRKWVVSAHDVP